METHPLFPNILLHDGESLGVTLGSEIAARETIHEWPLSCVQRLRLDDGRQLIYKSQLPPTVEAQFYEAASSPLLPGHQLLEKLGDCDIMTLEWIDMALLAGIGCSEAELVEHGQEVIAQIGQIEGDVPVYLDISTLKAWRMVAEVMLKKLRKIVTEGRFKSVSMDAVEQVENWAASDRVIATVTDCPRLVQGDLTADQIFVGGDGYRVIDWQRPLFAPPEVDLVALLVGQEIDPSPYVSTTLIAVFWFLRLHWAVEAEHDLFPNMGWPIFDHWATEAISHILEDWA